MSKSAPEDWSVTTIGKSCHILDSKRVPLNSQERALRKGDYPYYGANGVQGYIDDYIFEGEHVLLAEDGGYFDEWQSRPISYLVSGKFWVNNHAHILKARDSHETRYIHYSLVHKNILEHINGGTRSKLNQADMREIQILAPPLPEQQKIAAILSSVDDVIEKTRAQIDKLKDLKTGMMQELLTKGIGHAAFKDSPVGRIPASWKVMALNKLASIKHGYAFEGEYFRSTPTPNLLLTPGNFNKDGRLYFGPKTKYYDGPVPDGFVLVNGDVLVVMTDLTKEMTILGNTIILKSESTVLHNQRIGKVEILDNELISPEFLSFVMNSDHVKNHVKDTATGTTVRHTSPTKILEPLIPVPSIQEQKEIMGVFAALECRLARTESKLSVDERVKKALMQDLLTGKVRVNVDNKENAVA